ncbi:GNAT family N-acetyltransferase [Vibrio sp. 10N.222.51.C12]|uniref:GNAT family N-acetyltransferase n=1 Tax=unclassified Vibrio TaxID=2614977 RepID=UPI001F52F2BA|nr:GNAT family N-acetyltransferase [Vibrio sp. 10N.286.48.B7]
MMNIELRTINLDNFYEICLLEVAAEQANYVDSNAVSLAEANFMACPWFRGIYVNNNPVGFILVNADKVLGKCSLWRMMLDKSQQSKGYGSRAIKLLSEALSREFGVSRLYTSVVTGVHSPEGFYVKCGFVPTGRLADNSELELCLALKPQA